jgi:uridine monophosphate synthetase
MSEVTLATRERAAAAFYESSLLKFGQFTLKSGLTAPFYVDLRKAQSHPETFIAIVDVYAEMLEDADPSILLAGVPEAATPFAGALGYKLRRPLVQPRKVVKAHGTKSSVEGDYQPGDRVILLDDLITKGDSKLEAIKQVEDAGLSVDKCIVLIDMEHGGVTSMRDAGHTIEAAFTISELALSLRDQNKITQEQYSLVLDFIKAR